MGTAWVVVMDSRFSVRLSEVVMFLTTSLTRSSMRKRDSFHANRERKMVLCGKLEMLSASRDRIRAGLYMLLVRRW